MKFCIIFKFLNNKQSTNIPKSNYDLLYNVWSSWNFDFVVFRKNFYFAIFSQRYVSYNYVDILSCILVTARKIRLSELYLTAGHTANVTLPRGKDGNNPNLILFSTEYLYVLSVILK